MYTYSGRSNLIKLNFTFFGVFAFHLFFYEFCPGQPDASIPVKVAFLILTQTATHFSGLKGEKPVCLFLLFLYISICFNAVLALCSLYSLSFALVCKCIFFPEGFFLVNAEISKNKVYFVFVLFLHAASSAVGLLET